MLAGKLARGDSDKAGGNESVKEVRGFMGDVKKVGISWHVGGSWKQGAGVLPQVTPQEGTHLPPKKARDRRTEKIWHRDLTATTIIIKEVH